MGRGETENSAERLSILIIRLVTNEEIMKGWGLDTADNLPVMEKMA